MWLHSYIYTPSHGSDDLQSLSNFTNNVTALLWVEVQSEWICVSEVPPRTLLLNYAIQTNMYVHIETKNPQLYKELRYTHHMWCNMFEKLDEIQANIIFMKIFQPDCHSCFQKLPVQSIFYFFLLSPLVTVCHFIAPSASAARTVWLGRPRQADGGKKNWPQQKCPQGFSLPQDVGRTAHPNGVLNLRCHTKKVHTYCMHLLCSLIPRPLPNFIPQLRRKIDRRHTTIPTSQSRNGGLS